MEFIGSNTKGWLLALAMLAGCATTGQRVQEFYDQCRDEGSSYAACIAKAGDKRWELEHPNIEPATTETAPDGTKWYGRICYCPIAECRAGMDRDCPGGFQVEGQQSGEPLQEYGRFRQNRGYQIKYKCQQATEAKAVPVVSATSRCVIDTDCKDDRVCENAKCVTLPPARKE